MTEFEYRAKLREMLSELREERDSVTNVERYRGLTFAIELLERRWEESFDANCCAVAGGNRA